MSGNSSSPSNSTQWDTDDAGFSSDGDSSSSSIEPRRRSNERPSGKQTLYNRARHAILVRGARGPPREEEWEFDGPVPFPLWY